MGWLSTGRLPVGIAAEASEHPVLHRGVLGDFDLRTEHDDPRSEVAGDAHLRRDLLDMWPQALELDWIERVVLAGRPGEVPPVQDQVLADDAVDVLLERHPAHRRVGLGRGHGRVVEQGLDVGRAVR